jgi:hypothetical protein
LLKVALNTKNQIKSIEVPVPNQEGQRSIWYTHPVNSALFTPIEPGKYHMKTYYLRHAFLWTLYVRTSRNCKSI